MKAKHKLITLSNVTHLVHNIFHFGALTIFLFFNFFAYFPDRTFPN
jgi:hypothetical protein